VVNEAGYLEIQWSITKLRPQTVSGLGRQFFGDASNSSYGTETNQTNKSDMIGWWFGTFGLFFHHIGNNHHPN